MRVRELLLRKMILTPLIPAVITAENYHGEARHASTLCIAAFVAFAPAAHATTAEQMEANKKAVVEFYEFAVNKKDFEAAAKFLGPRYVQHNPNAADGPEGLKAYIAFLVFADGDFVIHHVHSVPTRARAVMPS
jgi:hypothetical protein